MQLFLRNNIFIVMLKKIFKRDSAKCDRKFMQAVFILINVMLIEIVLTALGARFLFCRRL